jgi:hypothetical protein
MAISRSGLPKTVLELFDPREDLEYKPPIDRRKPALPLLGLAGYVALFPGPDDPDYQPSRNEIGQKEDRKFRSKEFHIQVAVEEPSILERWASSAAMLSFLLDHHLYLSFCPHAYMCSE